MKSMIKTSLLLAALGSACAQAEEVRIYNWIEYIPADVITDFEKETGIDVIYDVFDSNEQMETKILTGNSGYDLTFPGSASLKRLIDAEALEPLDLSLLSNYSNLDPDSLANQRQIGDPKNAYAVPFMSGTNIIGYNPDLIFKATGKRELTSWDDVLKPEAIKQLSQCGVAFMDSPSEVMPILLSYLGLPHDSDSRKDYSAVTDYMKTIRPYIRYFNSSQYITDMVNGDICVAVGWSGSFNLGQMIADGTGSGVTISMSLPVEGAPSWYDSMVIPAAAPNPAAAHKFIDFMLQPENIARISNSVGYPNPNLKATPLVAENIRTNPALYIPEQRKSSLYPIMPIPLKAERYRTRAWTNIKSDR